MFFHISYAFHGLELGWLIYCNAANVRIVKTYGMTSCSNIWIIIQQSPDCFTSLPLHFIHNGCNFMLIKCIQLICIFFFMIR